MDFLYDWIKTICVYMILVSIIKNLLPSGQYEKYVRLFTGLLAIVLVLEPFSSFFGLQETIDDMFSLDVYSQEMDAMKLDITSAGEDFEEKVMETYEEQVKKQIILLLKDKGVAVRQVDFLVETTAGEKGFGEITSMEIYMDKTKMDKRKLIDASEIKEIVCAYYHLESEQVKVYE